MFAQDLNPYVLGVLGLAGVGGFAMVMRRALDFKDTTVEAVDLAPESINPVELRELLTVGDRANELLHVLRTLAVEHFEADPAKDQLTPAQVFHLANEAVSKPTFDEFASAFEKVLAITRKYKLALDLKTQRAIQKIYFAWDPSGNAIQVKTGDRLWKTEVKPGIEKLIGVSG